MQKTQAAQFRIGMAGTSVAISNGCEAAIVTGHVWSVPSAVLSELFSL
ncbi:MAG: hypothetical protein FWD64_01210 [Acidobacteriaceae bacterium]|nr:hypothetical protein [Acidobacteriaceae bacterium]